MNARKRLRLEGYDYAGSGGYFVTFCTKDREELLSDIRVGPDALIGPQVELTPCGKLVEEAILGAAETYPNVEIPCYAIMPNHVHLLVMIENGPMGASGPTLGMVVRSIKTRATRTMGSPIWQEKFYDHVIRNYDDYLRVWNYIDTNPARWAEDEYYTAQES
ncbi:MAG: transposase [Candidatus Enterenecus sp.]